MELIIIALASLVASLITLFSGFGLGTMLTPVFVLFFPVEIAVAMTGIVHFLNNIFKFGLLGKHTSWGVVVRFGIPSMLGAWFGAKLLVAVSSFEPLFVYLLAGKEHVVTPVKLIIAVLMIIFAFVELLPQRSATAASPGALAAGGVLSGFFGGLSGHQGALRSIFLLNYGLSKETFLATGITIACLVDITRLTLYATQFLNASAFEHSSVILVAVAAAFIGAFAGNTLVKKVTITTVQKIVTVMLIVIAVGLGTGLI